MSTGAFRPSASTGSITYAGMEGINKKPVISVPSNYADPVESPLQPPYAWLLAFSIYVPILLGSYLAGTIKYVFSHSPNPGPSPGCPISAYTAGQQCFLVLWTVFTGFVYYNWFPQWTKTNGRPFRVLGVVGMGVVTGVVEALVFTLLYQFFSSFDHWWLTGVVFPIVYIGLTAFYYAGVFNRYITPVHRVPSRDVYKIACLTASDVLNAVWVVGFGGGVGWLVLIQAFVLVGIVRAMHFPDPWDRYDTLVILPMKL